MCVGGGGNVSHITNNVTECRLRKKCSLYIYFNLKIRNIGLLLRNKRYLLIKNYYSTSPDHQTETVTASPALSDVTLIKLFAEIFVYNGVAAFLWTLNCILICCCCARFSSTKILSLFKAGLPHLASVMCCIFEELTLVDQTKISSLKMIYNVEIINSLLSCIFTSFKLHILPTKGLNHGFVFVTAATTVT